MGFDQSESAQGPIYNINLNNGFWSAPFSSLQLVNTHIFISLKPERKIKDLFRVELPHIVHYKE